MTVKSVIAAALRIIGRADTADAFEGGGTLCDEENELVTTLLYCYNAVEDEVARSYFSLVERETLSSANGKFFYELMSRKPLRILSVTADGKRLDFKVFAAYAAVNATKIEIEYEYLPEKKGLQSQCAFNFAVDIYLLACGVAAEYCLINGEVEAAELWEKRYREGLEKLPPATAFRRRGIPQRRWV